MEDVLVLISTYGFPMVMAVYLLVRIEPLIRGLKQSVDSLSLLVALQNDLRAPELASLKDGGEEVKKVGS